MRRYFSAGGWYLAGVLTLPLLHAGTRMMIATAADQHAQTSINEAESALGSTVAETDAVFKPTPLARPIAAGTREEIGLPPVQFESGPPEVAPAGLELKIDKTEDADPFSTDPSVRRKELGFDEPAAQTAPPIVLPVDAESLASDATLDEAALAKVKELRETLKKVVEEKAAKLSAAALEAEIQMHQRHLSDINALQELLMLTKSLKELSDKYPNSDSGRQAGEMLKLLERLRHAPAGTTIDIDIILPRQTNFARPRDAFDSAQDPSIYREQPIKPQK